MGDDLQLGAAGGFLELRAAGKNGKRLAGRFPYGSTTVLSDGGRTGRPRKERFRRRAFTYRVADPKCAELFPRVPVQNGGRHQGRSTI